MTPFLKETAKALLDSGRDLKAIRLVLPNRRAGLFFTKYLGMPTWRKLRSLKRILVS